MALIWEATVAPGVAVAVDVFDLHSFTVFNISRRVELHLMGCQATMVCCVSALNHVQRQCSLMCNHCSRFSHTKWPESHHCSQQTPLTVTKLSVSTLSYSMWCSVSSAASLAFSCSCKALSLFTRATLSFSDNLSAKQHAPPGVTLHTTRNGFSPTHALSRCP